MAYTPEWEPLADALERVIATGVGEDEVKVDLCRAVADRKIRIRVRVAARAGRGEVFANGNVEVPPHLKPADLDWVASRPFEPWPIGPKLGEHYSCISGWENKRIDLIEVSTADLIEVLCHGSSADARPTLQRPANDAPSSDAAAARARKKKAILEAADQLWSGEIPKGLMSKQRDKMLQEQIQRNGGSVPHSRTIQRALRSRRK